MTILRYGRTPKGENKYENIVFPHQMVMIWIGEVMLMTILPFNQNVLVLNQKPIKINNGSKSCVYNSVELSWT